MKNTDAAAALASVKADLANPALEQPWDGESVVVALAGGRSLLVGPEQLHARRSSCACCSGLLAVAERSRPWRVESRDGALEQAGFVHAAPCSPGAVQVSPFSAVQSVCKRCHD